MSTPASGASELANRVLQYLSSLNDGSLHAVLDAARSARILRLLHDSGARFESLYEGLQGEAMRDVAPHVVALPPDGDLLRRLVREGWGGAWGIFLTADTNLIALRTHLRKFLRVKLPDKDVVYFRYYDPRVLRVFLPTCDDIQRKELYGPISSFYMETEDGELLHFETSEQEPTRPLA